MLRLIFETGLKVWEILLNWVEARKCTFVVSFGGFETFLGDFQKRVKSWEKLFFANDSRIVF